MCANSMSSFHYVRILYKSTEYIKRQTKEVHLKISSIVFITLLFANGREKGTPDEYRSIKAPLSADVLKAVTDFILTL